MSSCPGHEGLCPGCQSQLKEPMSPEETITVSREAIETLIAKYERRTELARINHGEGVFTRINQHIVTDLRAALDTAPTPEPVEGTCYCGDPDCPTPCPPLPSSTASYSQREEGGSDTDEDGHSPRLVPDGDLQRLRRSLRQLQRMVLDEYRYFGGEDQIFNWEIDGREEDWRYMRGRQEAYEFVKINLAQIMETGECFATPMDDDARKLRYWRGEYANSTDPANETEAEPNGGASKRTLTGELAAPIGKEGTEECPTCGNDGPDVYDPGEYGGPGDLRCGDDWHNDKAAISARSQECPEEEQ